MSATKGWRCRIIIQGSPEDEEMIGSPASEGQTVFYTRNFPIVDALGNVTDSEEEVVVKKNGCLLYTSPSPRDLSTSRMPSSA